MVHAATEAEERYGTFPCKLLLQSNPQHHHEPIFLHLFLGISRVITTHRFYQRAQLNYFLGVHMSNLSSIGHSMKFPCSKSQNPAPERINASTFSPCFAGKGLQSSSSILTTNEKDQTISVGDYKLVLQIMRSSHLNDAQ